MSTDNQTSRFNIRIYVLCLILLGLLSYLAHRFLYLPGDIAISLWVQGTVPSSLDPIMRAVSYISSPIPATAIVTLLAVSLWVSGRRLEPVFIVILTISAALLDWLLKLLISQPRPSHELIQSLVESAGFSFPSGHVTYAIVFYGFLFYLVPRLVQQSAVARTVQSLLALLTILTVISRLYLGAHWTSDILGSFLLGWLILVPAIALYRSYVTEYRSTAEERNA